MRTKRNPELNRLYIAAGLGVLIWVIFQAYQVLGSKVDASLDGPSRWALLALGLANVLAIGTLLFIVARSLAKLYFERRSGILGSRIRTRLVLALLAVGIAPSLMLFLVGRNFISKNVDRWFRPETQQVIRDGRHLSDAYRELMNRHLQSVLERAADHSSEDLGTLRFELGADLLGTLGARGTVARMVVRKGLTPPPSLQMGSEASLIEAEEGLWLIQRAPKRRSGKWFVAGALIPRATVEGMTRLDKRYQEAFQVGASRETLETLPQKTFLFLTLLTLFAAVWVGLAISRTISEPVRALAKAAQRVGTGDLEVRLHEEGEDELALLSRRFNAMIRDLKEGREAVERQAASIERQRQYQDQLLEALPVGVMSWQQDCVLRTFNPAARRWFGFESWDPEIQSWEQIADQPRMGELPNLVQEVQSTRRSRQQELRIGGEGEGRPVRAMVLPLKTGGVLAVLEDLSLLAQAEKRAAWQEVARRMAHEVKNPLTPIKLTAQRILRRSREGRLDPGAVAEATETILTEVASLARLVDSFSRFAKLPAPQFRTVDVCDLVRQIEALYVPNHKQIQWVFEVPAEGVEGRWDADMVKRALINFVDNAIGAVEDEGRIRFSLRLAGDRAILEVEDSGAGVPEEARSRLFEPYFSTKKKGTGLGLAIARRIAQDHGGEALYEPLAQGSLFRLELPLEPRALL